MRGNVAGALPGSKYEVRRKRRTAGQRQPNSTESGGLSFLRVGYGMAEKCLGQMLSESTVGFETRSTEWWLLTWNPASADSAMTRAALSKDIRSVFRTKWYRSGFSKF